MKGLLTVALPGAVILCAFYLGGLIWGLAAFLLYSLISFYIKLPDILLVRGAKQYTTDKQRGLATMEKAMKTGRLQAKYIVYYSFVCLKSGELERAARILDAAAHKKMDEETACRAVVNRALLLWKEGDLEKAISLLEQQLTSRKDKAVYGTLGQFLLLNGQLQRALELNKEAYAFDRYDESITDNLALSYRLSGDLDSSYHMYKELTDKKLGIPVPYYHAGETFYAMGKKEEAVEVMEKALDYPFSFLAVVGREEIEGRIAEIQAEIK